MKDNEKNLSNELSNEAAEAVAGGGDWTPEDLATLGSFNDYIQQAALSFDSPREFVLHLLNLRSQGQKGYGWLKLKARPIRNLINAFDLDDDVRDYFNRIYKLNSN